MIGQLLAALVVATSPADTAALHWRSIGPFRGGRVLAVAGAADSPLHFYFGAVNGGVWETRDAGRTWDPIFDGAPVGSIGALAVAPSAPGVLYVGTGEADMRSDIAQGVGMFKSVDGGRTWSASGLTDSRQIAQIVVDPRDPNVVLVAALGHPYGPNTERGVFRSVDGGKTWTRTLFKDADTGAVDLAFKPGDPDTVYAALWQTRRPPWNVYPPSNGPGGGLYKSTDGGRTWAPMAANGLPGASGRIGLATATSAPDRLYALIDAKDAGGLYRSDDAGATWSKASGDPRIWERGWYFSGVTVNPKNADELWVCDTIVLHSADGGRTFIPQKGDPTGDDFHALWIDQGNPNRRILGTDQGALVTLNGGATWSSWYNQPTGQFYHVVTDNRLPYRVYGAQQDSGAASVPSRASGWDGINMTHFHEQTPGGESDNIAPDPKDPDTIYGGAWTSWTCVRARCAMSIRPWRFPTTTGRPGPCRWCSARPITGSISAISGFSAPPTVARAGRRSAPTSPVPILVFRPISIRRRKPTMVARDRARASSTASRPRRSSRSISGPEPTTASSGARATGVRPGATSPRPACRRGRRSAGSNPPASIANGPTSPWIGIAWTTPCPMSIARSTAGRPGRQSSVD